MKVLSKTVGAFQENAYLVIDETTNDAVFIDPGAEPDVLIELVRKSGAELRAIWLTQRARAISSGSLGTSSPRDRARTPSRRSVKLAGSSASSVWLRSASRESAITTTTTATPIVSPSNSSWSTYARVTRPASICVRDAAWTRPTARRTRSTDGARLFRCFRSRAHIRAGGISGIHFCPRLLSAHD